MRTLDEAIERAREVAKDKRADADWKWRHGRINADDCISSTEEHEQLAEWLERLKAYESDEFTSGLQKLSYQQGYSKAESDYFEKTQIDRESSYKIGQEVGYNRAIDDFVESLKEKYACCGYVEELAEIDIDEIAEQLKVGGIVE